MVINKENIEEYLLLLIDGELDAAAEGEVMTFIEGHEEYKLLLEQYLETKLDAAIISFDEKESLLKDEAAKVLPLKKNKAYMAWAAGIAAIVGIAAFWKITSQDVNPPVNIAGSGPSVVMPVRDTAVQQTVAIQSPVETAAKLTPKPSVPAPVVKEVKVTSEPAPAVDARTVTDEVEPLLAAGYRLMETQREIAMPDDVIALLPQPPTDDPTAGNPLSPLINPEKLELLNGIADQLGTVAGNIRAKVKSMRIASFAITFGNKEYTIVK